MGYLTHHITCAVLILSHGHVAAHKDYTQYIPAPYRAYVGDDVVEENSIQENYGPTTLIKKRLKTLSTYGPTHLEHTQILGNATIFGPLDGTHLTTKNLDVHGPVHLIHMKASHVIVKGPATFDHFTISGNTKIHGPLEASHGSFEGLHIYARKATLSHVKAKNITMASRRDKHPKLTLVGTTIHGDVVFQGTPGVVHLDKDSRIMGQIKNGKSRD